MSSAFSIRGALAALLKLPLYAVYGAYAIAAEYLRRMARLGDAARLLGKTLQCPSCFDANPIDGRWKCRVCSAVYHGEVFRCGFCGAGASFFSCRKCGISIPLGRVS